MSESVVIPIVYTGADFIIVNKPDGISVQNEQHDAGLLVHLAAQLNFEKLYLVHRLDKVTSGLLIVAFSSAAAARLSGYFARREIEKYYLAITDKKPTKSQGSVIGDMHKIRDGKWALRKTTDNPAIGQFFNLGLGDGQRLFIIKPLSGKTHQIRVMLKSLGSPILGDSLYTGTPSDRTYLHAYGINFCDQGQQITLTCLPSSGSHFISHNFENHLQRFLNPWQLPWPKLKLANKQQRQTPSAL